MVTETYDNETKTTYRVEGVDSSFVICTTQFGRTYDFNLVRFNFIMIRAWQS